MHNVGRDAKFRADSSPYLSRFVGKLIFFIINSQNFFLQNQQISDVLQVKPNMSQFLCRFTGTNWFYALFCSAYSQNNQVLVKTSVGLHFRAKNQEIARGKSRKTQNLD